MNRDDDLDVERVERALAPRQPTRTLVGEHVSASRTPQSRARDRTPGAYESQTTPGRDAICGVNPG